MVPAAVIKLNEADVALGEPPCQQTVRGKGTGLAGVFAVKFVDMLRLAGHIDQFGHAGLHPERHFVLRDARLDFRVADALV